jgi:hypothetical protein
MANSLSAKTAMAGLKSGHRAMCEGRIGGCYFLVAASTNWLV